MKHILITLFVFISTISYSGEVSYKGQLRKIGKLDKFERIEWTDTISTTKNIFINSNSIIIEDEKFEVLDFPDSYDIHLGYKSCIYQCMTKDFESVFIKILLYDNGLKVCTIKRDKSYLKYKLK